MTAPPARPAGGSGGDTLLRAAWLAPMDRPPIRDGAVVFHAGRILAAGDARPLLARFPDADIHDYGDAIILPGLVNAHTHLELSRCDPGTSPGGSFTDWILSIRERTRAHSQDVAGSTRLGIEQCLRFGVTTVGDVTKIAPVTRRVLSESPLRAVSFGEVLGLAKLRQRFDELFMQAVDETHASERLLIGLTPHAPYTVDLDGYRQCVRAARERNLPLATHLAETPDERAFLESHAGPLRGVWDRLGMWAEPMPTYPGGPMSMAHDVGLLDHRPTLLAHVNYVDDHDLDLLAAGAASVVYCPRTHAYFGHPPHPWREMLRRGINVSVGTDSCASSPSLNIVDDLRLLRRISPGVDAAELWELVTTRGARALGFDDVGSLTVGARADAVVFPARSAEPLREIFDEPALTAVETWIDGRCVFRA